MRFPMFVSSHLKTSQNNVTRALPHQKEYVYTYIYIDIYVCVYMHNIT